MPTRDPSKNASRPHWRWRPQVEKQWSTPGFTVEFALHLQHETSCDSEIQTKKDFKSKFRKQLGSSPTTSLNSEGKEETLECLKSLTKPKKNEDGHWICKHLVYKNIVLCIYLNYRIFTLHM